MEDRASSATWDCETALELAAADGKGEGKVALPPPPPAPLDLKAPSFSTAEGTSSGDLATEGDEDAHRHGNWLTATGMIICAVIGAGVLALPYSLAVLGWPAGIITMVLFAWITWYTSALLADVYILKGVRQASYMEAVRTSMGDRHAVLLGWVQYVNLFLTAVAFNVSGATSMQLVFCPAGNDSCSIKYWAWALIFGAIQLFVSQLPNLDSVAWISALGALMSFCYSLMAAVISIVYMANYGAAGGSVGGIPMSPSDKTFSIFNAIGSIVFAFSFSFILIEIAGTLKTDGKGPVWHMRRAVDVSLCFITAFYVLVSVVGYAAFGDRTCDDIVACFALSPSGGPSSIPLGVIRAVNAMVVVHLVPAYAVFSQPLFAFVEQAVARSKRLRRCLPRSLTGVGFRLAFRSLYVGVVCLIAACMPFFSSIMYIRKHAISGARWWALEALNFFCFVITILAIVGSVQSIVVQAGSYSFFS